MSTLIIRVTAVEDAQLDIVIEDAISLADKMDSLVYVTHMNKTFKISKHTDVTSLLNLYSELTSKQKSIEDTSDTPDEPNLTQKIEQTYKNLYTKFIQRK